MKKNLPSNFFHLTWWNKSSPWWWFNGAISNVSKLIDVSLQSMAGNLITKVSDKFYPKIPLTNQTQRDSFSQLSFVLSLKHNDFFLLLLFSPSTLNWIAHSDLKMLFMIESYTYLSKCQMCSQVAKSDFSVET